MGDLPRGFNSHKNDRPTFSVSATVGFEKATPLEVPWFEGQRLHEYTHPPKVKSTADSFGRWQYPERKLLQPGQDRDAHVAFSVSAIVHVPHSPTKEATMEERRRIKLSPENQQRNAEYLAATRFFGPLSKRTFVRGQGFRTNEERGYARAPPKPSPPSPEPMPPLVDDVIHNPVRSTTSSPAKYAAPVPPPQQHQSAPPANRKFLPFIPLFPPNWYDQDALLKMEQPEPPLGPIQLKLIDTVAKMTQSL